MKLKMFIWEGEGVLTDWSNGMIAVLAENHSQALKLIEEKCKYCMGNFPVDDYTIIEHPEAFICYGGG